MANVFLMCLLWVNPLTYGPTSPVVQALTAWSFAAWCSTSWALAGTRAIIQIRTVSAAWLLAAVVSACMGLAQYFGYAAHYGPWVNYTEAGQAYANLRQRNQLATLLAIGLCALSWWQCQMQANSSGQSRNLLLLLYCALAATLLATADAASGSRTGMLQLVLLLMLATIWKRGRATVVLVLLAYAVAAWVLPRLAGLDPLHSGILGRLSETSSVCASRLTLWTNVLHLIAQKPWSGWGWGELAYAHVMTLYGGERFCEIMGNAHNLPLHLAVELGIPVAALLCGLVLFLVLRAKPWREQDATRQMAWSVLAVIGAHSLLEYPLWYGPFQLAALLAVWMLWQTRASANSVATSGTMWAALPSAIAIGVMAACAYAGWDYWRISQIYLPEAQRAPSYRDDTLEKIRPSWLFADQVKFAELGITPLTPENAAKLHALALEMLHFSPEASVLIKVIESADRLGLSDEAETYRQRFRAAYPQEYAAWLASKKTSGSGDKTP
jgi:O-antigen ligase